MMEVTYTGKTTDEGPKFSIVNKSKQPILFGSLVAYFYDKSDKQLEVTADGKPRPMQVCSGRIFAGAVKPGEKIFMFFSCVKKAHVPEGTAAIQAEVKTVGFTDDAGRGAAFIGRTRTSHRTNARNQSRKSEWPAAASASRRTLRGDRWDTNATAVGPRSRSASA
jgi:hypothetical protein